MAQLRASATRVPQIEAELAQLNRDYEVVKGAYQTMVSRREKAALSEDVDATRAAQFQVIDPPVAAFEPVAPDRFVLLSAVLIVALGAAGGAAYLLNMIRPVFYNTRTLGDVIGLPVIGPVGRTWTDQNSFWTWPPRRTSTVVWAGISGWKFA